MSNVPKIWLTKKDASLHLKSSLRSIENYISKGLIKSYKIGGKILIEQNELDDVILKSRSGSKRKS